VQRTVSKVSALASRKQSGHYRLSPREIPGKFHNPELVACFYEARRNGLGLFPVVALSGALQEIGRNDEGDHAEPQVRSTGAPA
jgi:hypothetical protein